MSQRIIQVKVVPSVDNIDDKKRSWKLALFNEDGSPFVAGAGGGAVPALVAEHIYTPALAGAGTWDGPDIELSDDTSSLQLVAEPSVGGGAKLNLMGSIDGVTWRLLQAAVDITVADATPPAGMFKIAIVACVPFVRARVTTTGAPGYNSKVCLREMAISI